MSYLSEQYGVLEKHFSTKIICQYKDGVGVYCYRRLKSGKSEFLFVAKNSTLHGIVSIHKNIVEFSASSGMQIVMSVLGSFYKFYGSAVLIGKQFENEYNGAKMVNFYLNKVGAERINLPNEVNPLQGLIPKSVEQMKIAFQEKP